MEEKQEEFDFEADYEVLKKEYNLPDFEILAQDFDIEKIADKETAFLVREIRRAINEKITAYIHLFETLINPNSPPIFVFKILKNISPQDKETIQDFYNTLSKTQLEIMKLDTIYSEKSEVAFVNDIFKVWQNIKPKIFKLIENFETNFENDSISKERSYFD